MNHPLFIFDGGTISREFVESPGRLRWACWNSDGVALLVGDKGAALVYDHGRFRTLQTQVTQNLRCAEFSPEGHTAYLCGNRGTILYTDLGSVQVVQSDARENLRRLAWNPHGQRAIFVGNNGGAYALRGKHLERIHGAETNLRSIAWHPEGEFALVSGNCFRSSFGGLTPSPNLFRYDEELGALSELQDVSKSRTDLTSSAWRPGASQCLLVGYDQTWHTPAMYLYDENGLHERAWGSEHLFPTICAWHPSGEYALVGTGLMRTDEGDCSIYRYDDHGIRKLFDLGRLGVSCISWSAEGRAFVLASPAVKAYSA